MVETYNRTQLEEMLKNYVPRYSRLICKNTQSIEFKNTVIDKNDSGEYVVMYEYKDFNPVLNYENNVIDSNFSGMKYQEKIEDKVGPDVGVVSTNKLLKIINIQNKDNEIMLKIVNNLCSQPNIHRLRHSLYNTSYNQYVFPEYTPLNDKPIDYMNDVCPPIIFIKYDKNDNALNVSAISGISNNDYYYFCMEQDSSSPIFKKTKKDYFISEYPFLLPYRFFIAKDFNTVVGNSENEDPYWNEFPCSVIIQQYKNIKNISDKIDIVQVLEYINYIAIGDVFDINMIPPILPEYVDILSTADTDY